MRRESGAHGTNDDVSSQAVLPLSRGYHYHADTIPKALTPCASSLTILITIFIYIYNSVKRYSVTKFHIFHECSHGAHAYD